MKMGTRMYCLMIFFAVLAAASSSWECILKYSIRAGLRGMETLNGELIDIYYRGPAYEDEARWYLKQGEVWLKQTRLLMNQETPADRVPVVLGEGPVCRLPSAIFSENPMAGCFWLGHVFIIKTNDTCPPLSHELAHRVMDEATKGRCPRWFTEGFAQYMEVSQAGFILGKPAPGAMRSPYSLKQLEMDFDTCPDQKLAYWQAKTAFCAILETADWTGIHHLTQRLSRGTAFSDAFEAVTHMSFEQWEQDLFRQRSAIQQAPRMG